MKSRGFTLVEMLTAIAILSLMALLSWRAIDGMNRTQSLSQQRTDAVQRLQTGLGQWMADLDAVIDTDEVTPIEFNGQALRLTRRDSADTSLSSTGVRVVAWARLNTGEGSRWMRWQSGPVQQREALARAWQRAGEWSRGELQPQAGNAAGDSAVAIVPLVQWQLFFHRGETWGNPLSSVGSVQGEEGMAAASKLPNGVRLLLTLPDGGELAGTLTRDWVRPTLEAGR